MRNTPHSREPVLMPDGTFSRSWYLYLTGIDRLTFGENDKVRVDGTTTAGQTALLLWDVDNGTLERVTVGVADSGGLGWKLLRIAN